MFTELQQMRQQLPDMEFGRRMAVERELEKVDGIRLTNIIFDETGHFVLYGTMLGIKVINVETNRCVQTKFTTCLLGPADRMETIVQLSTCQTFVYLFFHPGVCGFSESLRTSVWSSSVCSRVLQRPCRWPHLLWRWRRPTTLPCRTWSRTQPSSALRLRRTASTW